MRNDGAVRRSPHAHRGPNVASPDDLTVATDMSKRRRFAHLLHRTGALRAILALRSRTAVPWLSVLTYHRIANGDGTTPFDEGVVDVTAA